MKATLIFIAYVAIAAAAPQGTLVRTRTATRTASISSETISTIPETVLPPSGVSAGPSKRCRGPGGKECNNGESCLGERELDDGLGGICVKSPKPCANFLGDTCNDGDFCVEDPDENCPLDVMDCGQGLCLPAALVKRANGATKVGKEPFRCGGKSGKKCRDNMHEVCVGEGNSNDGMGVCVWNPKACNDPKGGKCRDEKTYRCVKDSRNKSSGLCVRATWADQFGLKGKCPS
ncbi:hypothetical protein TWF718_009638 [Orbilia javanica]|uniref:Uncharacterized protein n=1 Tax=Orbilia javanica TaxID=47235 RepID=A0AAN8REW1_9PEZI